MDAVLTHNPRHTSKSVFLIHLLRIKRQLHCALSVLIDALPRLTLIVNVTIPFR